MWFDLRRLDTYLYAHYFQIWFQECHWGENHKGERKWDFIQRHAASGA